MRRNRNVGLQLTERDAKVLIGMSLVVLPLITAELVLIALNHSVAASLVGLAVIAYGVVLVLWIRRRMHTRQ